MTIGGFRITKKVVLIGGGILAFILISSSYSSWKKNKEVQERLEASKYEATTQQATTEYNFHDQFQESLRKKYGDPPEGFEWDSLGNLVAVDGDVDMSCEDVVYTYLRSLSILDFATAQRYASSSTVSETYSGYYNDVTAEIADYYNDFLRKQFKFALTTLEIENVSDTAVFPDGTQYVSVDLNVLDLTDKDFWLADKDTIFDNMYTYDVTETDGTKMEQYIYDYIYNAYEQGKIGKHKITVEIVVSKGNGEGWLVSNDGELSHQLSYEWGTDVAAYIKQQYQSYSIDRQIQESIQDYNPVEVEE